jgi:hypothetical protein
MAKSYSKFTLDDITELGIEVIENELFKDIEILSIEPTPFLKTLLEKNLKKKLRTEKAKSERIISPILWELEDRNLDRFACYSGYPLNVDAKLGLTGFCDFIFSAKTDSLVIEAPVFCVIEAKNDNLDDGIAQCVAEMYAAALFNQKKKQTKRVIYGVVTFGFEWKFICLENLKATADNKIYYLNQLPQIIGIMQYMMDNSLRDVENNNLPIKYPI